LAVGCWLLAVGCWLLAVGCWLLAVGCWLLAVGCWLLAVGCWLLENKNLFSNYKAIKSSKNNQTDYFGSLDYISFPRNDV
jgi:predicted tellurium resistance membrane protein TerC